MGKIRFKGLKGGDSISKWDYNGNIPHVQHGSCVVHEDYYVNGAEIIGFSNEYYEVKYKDIRGNYVILGFLEDWLEEFTPISKENNLLEEAKRRYPIGTTVHITTCGSPYTDVITAQKHVDYPRGITAKDDIWFMGKSYGLKIYCTDTGKWAEIVSEGKKYPVTPDNAYKEVSQAQAIIQPVLKSLEENDERIDSSINRISSVSNNLVLEEV